MLNPFIWLLLLSITLLIGAFLFGSIPLAAKLSETKLRYLTALGVGLLVSTALVVIIPEGIDTLYSSHTSAFSNETDDTSALHSAVGLSLVFGFATMFIVDQLSSMHVHASAGNESVQASTDNNPRPFGESEDASESLTRPVYSPTKSARAITPTIGLIVHAAADGIALGASASHPQLSMVVFIAIMLHKGPSAFALTTVLLAEGVSRVQVRKHLLMFSMAAPLGAILTYLVLYMTSSTASAGIEYWTGVLLIYSGGTFLYVAMHALQEVNSVASHSNKMSREEIGTILLGMFLPVLINIKHSH
ncbi:Zinc/iron permease [Phycomyces nitens]|nr:Zinc/iron permease [Phycomyces nitens]